jgi:hypothetical protein
MGLITYFIQRGEKGPIKIGHTTSARLLNRLRILQTASPERLTVLAAISGGVEKKLGQQFAGSRLSGEWFKPTKDLLAFISQLIESGLAKHVGYTLTRKRTGVITEFIRMGFMPDQLKRIRAEAQQQKVSVNALIRTATDTYVLRKRAERNPA